MNMNAVALLKKYFTDPLSFGIILEHSSLVAAKAIQVAKRLGERYPDLGFIEEAALIHDIGVCRTNSKGLFCNGNEPYIRHGIIGRSLLESEGFPRHAMLCERHIGVGITAADVVTQELPLPARDMVPLSLEERIVSFADLFYSKEPNRIGHEKSVAEIRKGLARHGSPKLSIFDQWLDEFDYQSFA